MRCSPGEALEQVPRSAREAGHAVTRRGHDDQDRAGMSENSRRGFFRELASVVGVGARGRRRDAAPPPPPPDLTDAEIERYSRQLVLPEWGAAAQLAVTEASVLVIGAGALGAPVALYLAGAGVGRIGILDDDEVELSNLHRQLLHFTPDLGVPEGGERGREAALPQPRRRRRALPGARRRPRTRRRSSRARTSSSTARTRSRPATRSTPPAARRACRWSRPACSAWPGW